MITCTFEDGNQTNLRHLVVHAIIVRGNKVLLNKRGTYHGKPILESGKWSLISGYVDRDETSQEAIRREAQEEANIKITKTTLLRINDNPDRPQEDRQNIAFVFIAEAEGEGEIVSEEATALQWFDLNDLPPDQEMAFDHKDDIALYKRYVMEHISIPVIG